MQAIKTRGHKALAQELADFAAQRLVEGLLDVGPPDAVYAVPASHQGQRFRGFSLPQIMEEKICEKSGWSGLAPELRRAYRSSTKSSHGLTKGERLRRSSDLVENSRPQSPLGTLLLVDDVVTTGATLSRCVVQAKAHGFERVLCFAIAEARPFSSEAESSPHPG
jgi:predicted amidophosphoribosyltransferase